MTDFDPLTYPAATATPAYLPPKDLDASAGIAAHDHTTETGHATTVYSDRHGINWCCQAPTCPSYGV